MERYLSDILITIFMHFSLTSSIMYMKISFSYIFVVGLFVMLGWVTSYCTGGPNILDKRVGTGPTVIYFGPACAQTMLCLPNLWSHAHGKRSCNGRVMVSRCINNKRKYFCH